MAKESESEAQAELDAAAQRAFVLRTKSMSDKETLEYVSATLALVANSKPQRRK